MLELFFSCIVHWPGSVNTMVSHNRLAFGRPRFVRLEYRLFSIDDQCSFCCWFDHKTYQTHTCSIYSILFPPHVLDELGPSFAYSRPFQMQRTCQRTWRLNFGTRELTRVNAAVMYQERCCFFLDGNCIEVGLGLW